MPRRLKVGANPGHFRAGKGKDDRRSSSRAGLVPAALVDRLNEQLPGAVDEVRRVSRDLVKRNKGAPVAAKQAATQASLWTSAMFRALADGNDELALKFSREAEACRRRVQVELDNQERVRSATRASAEGANDEDARDDDLDDSLDSDEAAELLRSLNPDLESPSNGSLGVDGHETAERDENRSEAVLGPSKGGRR